MRLLKCSLSPPWRLEVLSEVSFGIIERRPDRNCSVCSCLIFTLLDVRFYYASSGIIFFLDFIELLYGLMLPWFACSFFSVFVGSLRGENIISGELSDFLDSAFLVFFFIMLLIVIWSNLPLDLTGCWVISPLPGVRTDLSSNISGLFMLYLRSFLLRRKFLISVVFYELNCMDASVILSVLAAWGELICSCCFTLYD